LKGKGVSLCSWSVRRMWCNKLCHKSVTKEQKIISNSVLHILFLVFQNTLDVRTAVVVSFA
jgi:hypothetical protein